MTSLAVSCLFFLFLSEQRERRRGKKNYLSLNSVPPFDDSSPSSSSSSSSVPDSPDDRNGVDFIWSLAGIPKHLPHAPLLMSDDDKMYILPQRMHSSCGSPANIDINFDGIGRKKKKEKEETNKKTIRNWMIYGYRIYRRNRVWTYNNEEYYGRCFFSPFSFYSPLHHMKQKQQKQKKPPKLNEKKTDWRLKVLVGCCNDYTTYNANRLICVYGNIIHVRVRYYTYVTVWPTHSNSNTGPDTTT